MSNNKIEGRGNVAASAGDADNGYEEVSTSPIGAQKRALDTVPYDFYVAVSQGKIPGHRIQTFFGHNPLVGTTEETIWPHGGRVVFPSAAAILTVSSSSANDTSAGTGLRTILVNGLDANFLEISEVVILNGQTPVNTVNSYIRVNTMIGLTAGSGGVNDGNVYIGSGTVTAGVPAVVVNLMPAGANIQESGFFTIPANKTGYLIQAYYDGEANKFLVMNAYVRPANGIFLRIAAFNLSGSDAPLLGLHPPDVYTSGLDLEFRGIIDVQTGDVKIAASILLVDNDA